MTKSEKFLEKFKKLEKSLREMVNKPKYIPFWELVKEARKINPVVEEYQEDLRELAELRNGIVHTPKGKIIAEVSDFAIELIQEIYQKITKPPTAFEIASRPVYCCQLEDSLLSQLKVMREKIYTHVPVYNGEKFVGVLSENSIFNWYCDVGQKISISSKTKVKEIKPYLDIHNRENEYFEFVKKDENAYKIKKWFSQAIKKNKRLGAVFVTKDGTPKGEMLGIITAWDLPRIK